MPITYTNENQFCGIRHQEHMKWRFAVFAPRITAFHKLVSKIKVTPKSKHFKHIAAWCKDADVVQVKG